MVADETNDSITLNNGVVIEVATASFRVTRGYSFAAVLADEVAFWRSDDSVNPDVEIIGALRPGLASIPGSMLLLASSPYRKRGVLHATFAKHYGRDDARVLVWKAPTLVMNPGLDPAIVAEAYEDDAEAAAAEYGAEFRSDLSDFVPRAVVDACTPPGRFEVPPVAGTRYVAFVDPSGGSADSMTLAIAHRHGDKAILDAVREVRPPFSPENVTSDFAAVLRTYGLSRLTGDRYGGEWPRERFRVHGVEYALSERPKSEIYLDGLPLLNGGRVELLAIPRLTAQLCGLERRTARSGRDSIDHAPGGARRRGERGHGGAAAGRGRKPGEAGADRPHAAHGPLMATFRGKARGKPFKPLAPKAPPRLHVPPAAKPTREAPARRPPATQKGK